MPFLVLVSFAEASPREEIILLKILRFTEKGVTFDYYCACSVRFRLTRSEFT